MVDGFNHQHISVFRAVNGFNYAVRKLAGMFYCSALKFSNISCIPFVEEHDDDEQEEEEEGANKEVTEPSKQVKRTVMHCMHYNALTTHSCFY